MVALSDRNGDGFVSNMAIVAHIDDDLLFMNPDIIDAIESGANHTTVYVTAGDAGYAEDYWSGREDGAKAAYAVMAGSNDWIDETVTLSDGAHEIEIQTSYLASQPNIRLYFLRIPDGYPGGGGTTRYDGDSLEKLWQGTIEDVTTVDGQNSYSRSDLTRILQALIEHEQADNLMIEDHETHYTSRDHSDHIHTAVFAEAAAAAAGTIDPTGYITYATSDLPVNVEDNSLALEVVLAYAAHDPALDPNGLDDGVITISPTYEGWTQRQYYTDDFLFSDPDVNKQFMTQPDSWDPTREVRMSGDADGDGIADLISFAVDGVDVGASGSDVTSHWISDFGYASGGWRISQHVRRMGDVDGDGKEDVVGFGATGVLVSLSTGDSFQPVQKWLSDYSYYRGGWRVDRHERMLGDIDGDGKDDVVGFGGAGVLVSLSTGSAFQPASVWLRDFSISQGWQVSRHERRVADVDGDGKDDVIGFADDGVHVALSTGDGFGANRLWIADFGYIAGGWRVGVHDREVADVNGDGMADVVGFGSSGVLVALSNGNGFDPIGFWSDDFGSTDGWNASRDDRIVADVNGDGMADLVCIGETGTSIALSDGNRFVTVSGPAFDATISALGAEFDFV